jgi:hypothetical protein
MGLHGTMTGHQCCGSIAVQGVLCRTAALRRRLCMLLFIHKHSD